MAESIGAVSMAAWPKTGIKWATVQGLLRARKRTLCADLADSRS